MFNCFFVVDLENVIYLLKFLQSEARETEEQPINTKKIIKKVIESSAKLQQKIREYLYSLTVTVKQFQDIEFIISSISTSPILLSIEKVELLVTLMRNTRGLHSFEFLEQWFYIFLTGDVKTNERNWSIYPALLENWFSQFDKDYAMFIKILMKMDKFVKAFLNKQYQSFFVKYAISSCFQTGK